jgi:hypothetical protein
VRDIPKKNMIIPIKVPDQLSINEFAAYMGKYTITEIATNDDIIDPINKIRRTKFWLFIDLLSFVLLLPYR